MQYLVSEPTNNNFGRKLYGRSSRRILSTGILLASVNGARIMYILLLHNLQQRIFYAVERRLSELPVKRIAATKERLRHHVATVFLLLNRHHSWTLFKYSVLKC
jgi:hypothetical protein